MVDQDNCNEGGDDNKDIVGIGGGESELGDSSRSHTTRESKNDRDEGRSDERSNRKSLSDDDDDDDDDSDDDRDCRRRRRRRESSGRKNSERVGSKLFYVSCLQSQGLFAAILTGVSQAILVASKLE